MESLGEPHVVIIGGGFGGINTARYLRGAPVRVTLIDRSNHHLFQPLLYQVATAGLSPADIAVPIRAILRRQKNAEVLMSEVVGVDVAAKRVRTRDRDVDYDYLVLATGATHSYFSHDEWAQAARGLKSITDATSIRERILSAFEAAEMEQDPEKQRAWLTFVVVGGGPTGVEMAGSIGELSRYALARDFRRIDPSSANILLLEAGPKILATFPDELSQASARKLASLGVSVRTGGRVTRIDEEGVEVSGSRISAKTVIWAAGVQASPAGKWIGAELDRAGRVKVNPDLTPVGFENRGVFVLGDTASLEQDGKPLPGVAPVAMQQGRYLAGAIRARVRGETPPPFRYWNKGNLATVGRRYAVADLGFLRLRGFLAWAAWVVVHIYYLIGFRNRIIVLIEWAWAYVTFGRGARLITHS